MAWRVSNITIAEEIASQDRKHAGRPLASRLWRVFRPVAVAGLLVGQPLAALLALGMLLSLASIFTGRPPASAFWIVAALLGVLNALVACGAWRIVLERLRANILDPHAILLAVGFTGAFGVAALWILGAMNAT